MTQAVSIGITGGLGSGKSTVLQLLKRKGAVTIDADKLAHRCLAPGKPAYRKALRRFGREILGKGKTIDRKRLGRVVFGDRRARRELERWIHPEVKREIQRRLKKLRASKTVAVEVPLLFESGFQTLFDRTVVVWCNGEIRRRRLQKRNRWPAAELRRRFAAQWPLQRKRRMADFVIDNSGNIDVTKKQVEKIWKDSIVPLRRK